jgi:hypothetical protein
MASDDPEFEEKAADIIGLYLKPPVNAAVFCVDSEERDSSTRPTRSGLAALPWQSRTAWL